MLWPACTQKPTAVPDKSALVNIVHSFYQSFEQKDMALMADLMAHDESMLSFGTSAADIHHSWTGWKTNHLAQFEAIDTAVISSKNLQVYTSRDGGVAWFADVTDWDLVVQQDSIHMPGIRITGVLEKREQDWKIVQIHASVPQE